MTVYSFWNNKGGTGKTSLSFQVITRYAEKYPEKKILAIDICPQSNLSELFLGGLLGSGSRNLSRLYNASKRMSVGGYFQDRLPSPFTVPTLNVNEYICQPHNSNSNIPSNIDLLAGDPIVELQTNSIATLSNTQLAGVNTWISVIDWLNDFINMSRNTYDDIFMDLNPSFSIYTQIALAATQKLIIPVMADDSSRRALQNAFALVHGISLPSQIYNQQSFSTKLNQAGRQLPKVHLVVKNRLTQYMGSASAYYAVLLAINNDLQSFMAANPGIFTFDKLNLGIVEVRDFQTTGVVAFAEGNPFAEVSAGIHNVLDKKTQISADYIRKCSDDIEKIVAKL
jgi:cellulose biosynthesis protein BcsQ